MQTNSELIQAVLARNDHQAFECLLLRYERLVWTTVWQILRDYHATQDGTQETFLIAHKRLHELREPDAVGVWLCQIARREAFRANQDRNAMQSIDGLDPPAAGPANQASDEQQAMIDAIGRLPEHERVSTPHRQPRYSAQRLRPDARLHGRRGASWRQEPGRRQ